MIGRSFLAAVAARAAAGALVVALAGCTVGETYRPPVVAVPLAFSGATARNPAGNGPANWWSAFGDPTLDALIQRALRDSPDVGIALSRVEQARLAEVTARAAGRPNLAATANVSRIDFSKNAGFASLARQFSGSGGAGGSGSGGSTAGGFALPGGGITTEALGFDASWELDLFGGVRRGVEAAQARSEAAVWNARDAQVTLSAEIAQAYFALRLDQVQIASAEQQLLLDRRVGEIAAHVADVGLAPRINVPRQHVATDAIAARLGPLRADAALRCHALALLTGQPPESLDASALPMPATMPGVPEVPAGLPSELLRRRPDIRAAERAVAASTADIGVAIADLYPKLDLTGAAQLISSSLATLFSGNSLQLTGSAATRFPLLDGGRRRATVALRRAERNEAVIAYRGAVLRALRDVEDALTRIDGDRAQGVALVAAVADEDALARSANDQFTTGLVAEDVAINARVDELSARDRLAANDAQQRQDVAALVKALGGGWHAEAP